MVALATPPKQVAPTTVKHSFKRPNGFLPAAGFNRKAVDTECTGGDLYHGVKPFMVSILYTDRAPSLYVWPVDPMTREPLIPAADLVRLKAEIEDPEDTLIFHNALFDVRALQTIIPDLDIKSVYTRAEDTMLMHHVLDSDASHKLKDIGVRLKIRKDDQEDLKEAVLLSRKYAEKLGWKIANAKNMPFVRKAPKDEKGDGWWVMDMWLPAAYIRYLQELNPDDRSLDDHPWLTLCEKYCHRDTERTLVADHVFTKALEKHHWRHLYDERRALFPSMHLAKQRGFTVNLKLVDSEIERCKIEAKKWQQLAASLCDRPEYNPNSSDQAQIVFYHHFAQPITHYTDKGFPSTDRHAVIDMLQSNPKDSLVYRFLIAHVSCKKFIKALEYLHTYKRCAIPLDDGTDMAVIHPDLLITGTKTTRFSSQNPNAQQISKGKEAFIEEAKLFDLTLRKLFGPRRGREWWTVDGKQLQLVIFAYCSGEESMIAAVKAGMDFHTFMQQAIFGDKYDPTSDSQRTIAKNVNFGFIFGAQPKKIEKTAGRPGLWSLLQSTFPNATGYLAKNQEDAKKTRKVYTVGGYPLVVPRKQPHAATNYIVQGSEGIIMQRAMIYCAEYLEEHCPDAYVCMQVHDELVFDFPAGLGDYHITNLMNLMRKAGAELGVPCDVDAKYVKTQWNKSTDLQHRWYPTLTC